MNSFYPSYRRHRFPAEIVSHCVRLYFRFSLSFRDIEEMMAKRGVAVSYESIREWCLKFGGTYAKRVRSRSPRSGSHWHLNDVFLRIGQPVLRKNSFRAGPVVSTPGLPSHALMSTCGWRIPSYCEFATIGLSAAKSAIWNLSYGLRQSLWSAISRKGG